LADLAQHRAILFHGHEGHQRWTLNGPKGTEHVGVSGPINVDDMGMQLALVERDVGVARVPLLLVEESLRKGRLVRVLPEYTRKEASLYLVYPALRQVPTRVRLLRDFLFDELKRGLAQRV
jgi:DNA-binding transcriptional LysR family regulator